MESPDILLPFGHADTERLVTKRKQGTWMFSLMSRILMKIDGFMPWRASGVSWEALEEAPEASWEGPRDFLGIFVQCSISINNAIFILLSLYKAKKNQ